MLRRNQGKPRLARRSRRFGLGAGLEGLEGRALLSTATFSLQGDWGSGFGGQISIANTTAAAVPNWTLGFTFDRSITTIWNASIVSHTGNQYVITNAGYNSTIAPNSSVSFGFNGSSGNVGTDQPTGYTLNGVSLSNTPTTPSLSVGDVSVNDGPAGATATFNVTLSAPAQTAVSVQYVTADGTAKAGTDYTAKSGTLTFAPGSVSQTVSIPIAPDTTPKPNESFALNLSNPVGATITQGSGVATIVDTVANPNGNATALASFQVTQDWGSGFGGQITVANLSASPVNNWTLAFTFDRTITSIWDASIVSHTGNQYVIKSASYNSTIAANGGLVSFGFDGSSGGVGTDQPSGYALNGTSIGNGVPGINVGNVTVNDNTVGGTATFNVTLTSASTTPVTVQYATSNGTAKAGTEYTAKSGILTFAPGTLSMTVTVPIAPDTTAKANQTFQFNLSNATSAILETPTATGTIVNWFGKPDIAPTAASDSSLTLENKAVSINVLANDVDTQGNLLKVTGATQGSHGSVVVNQDGTITYTPSAGFLGADTFTYTISDGNGGTATSTVTVTAVSPTVSTGNWPTQVFAPYVDVTQYPAPDLVSTMKATGLKYFSLAFITADPNGLPAWGGYPSYGVNGGDFDTALQAQISQIRQLGGDVVVSFGGENGQELAQVVTNVATLTSEYQQVINTYGLTHIDFDIEGGAVMDPASIDRRSQAIAALQATARAAGKDLVVSFTLPVLPSGLTSDGMYVLQSALKYGVDIGNVNGMAMDYGDSAAPNPQGQMGTYAIDSAESVFAQLGSLYGSTRTTSQLWSMVGVTPMIGVNDNASEIFEEADATQLTTFATQNHLGRIAMWSLNRDKSDPAGALNHAESTSSSIVQQPYDYSRIFNTFTN